MTLTPSRKRWLRFALQLAIEWEASLEDANTPSYGYKPRGEMARTIRACQRNIKKFKQLKEMLK